MPQTRLQADPPAFRASVSHLSCSVLPKTRLYSQAIIASGLWGISSKYS